MTVTVNAAHPNMTISGKVYSCTHLTASVHSVAASNAADPDIRVRVSFNTHVYSESCQNHQADFMDELNRPRIFCPVRYAETLALPTFCADLIGNNGSSWISEDMNGSLNMATIGQNPPQATGNYQIVLFYLYPSALGDIDVEMIIVSAFEKRINVERKRRNSKSKRNFGVVQKIRQCFYNKERVPPDRSPKKN